MRRIVATETLDGLAADDRDAMRSRRDLQRVHRAMGTCSIVAQGLRRFALPQDGRVPLRVLELGAGDGSLMLRVAQALAPKWPQVELTLLDRQALVERATIERYARLGWIAAPAVTDVHDWVRSEPDPARTGTAGAHWDVIVANLFLHHFEGTPLAALMAAIAARADCFLACEPRRAWLALAGSHAVAALGANAVTREDAVLSVHAGFGGRELSACWPADAHWRAHEYPAGLFSHCFAAERVRVH
jgi:hypothetical protein